MPLYAVIYTMRDIEKNKAHRAAHIECLKKLLREQKIETGWKFPDYAPGAVQGILICRAASTEEVAAWFREDPVIVAGARTFEVREAQAMEVQA